jgi:2,3-bisphosphoglycerate-independent phosphoglycerate mutase
MLTHSPPLVLVVLDGWGLRQTREHNAIALADTPVYDELVDRFPHASLVASGEAVGLPADQMGNSEVGHMNLGAGRVVYQDITRIDAAIADGALADNVVLTDTMRRCADRRALHLVGLVSDGGVHSHRRHLEALLARAADLGVSRLFVHALTDGRDTPPNAGVEYVTAVEQTMDRLGVGRIASVCGRYFAMDRDRRWPRTKRSYDAIVSGEARPAVRAADLLTASYAEGVTDEFVEPAVIVDADGRPIGRMDDDDSVIFFNFRADRARQLTRAVAFSDFDGFARRRHPRLHCTTLTEYDATYGLDVLFPPQEFSSNLAEVLATHGVTNLRLAETEKYAHVTYFFNSGEERPYAGENRILVPSPQVPTYDLQPEMSARGITDHLVEDVQAGRHRMIICNFANADMVGHTGKLDATVGAVTTLDGCLGRIVEAVRAAGGTVVVTADHGNAELLWDAERQCPHTAHTMNTVPVLLIGGQESGELRDGTLRDVAPPVLALLGIEPAPAMTGRDLRVAG